MASAITKVRLQDRMTVDEFLAWDDGTATRYELIDGRPTAMTGAIGAHAYVANTFKSIADRRLAVPCRALIGAGLKRAIRASGSTRLADTPADAQAIFLPTVEEKLPIILSLSSAGRVREKRLRYRFGYRIVDSKGRDLVLPGMVELNRDLTYSDSDVLAKTQEEQAEIGNDVLGLTKADITAHLARHAGCVLVDPICAVPGLVRSQAQAWVAANLPYHRRANRLRRLALSPNGLHW